MVREIESSLIALTKLFMYNRSGNLCYSCSNIIMEI